MKVDLPRLLITPHPRPDESLMGYILRLTEENGYSSPSWIFGMAGLKIKFHYGGWPYHHISDVNTLLLEKVIGLEHQEIQRLRRQTMDRVEFKFIKYGFPKICPACLKQSSYYRSIWDLLPFTACPLHGVVLINTCPGCGKPISWVRRAVSQCLCGMDWRDCEVIRVKPGSLNLQKFIYESWNSSNRKITSPAGQENPLYTLELNDLFQALSLIVDFYLSLARSGQTINTYTPSWHKSYTFAASIFEDWPRNYFEFLEWVKRHGGEQCISDLHRLASERCESSSLFFVIGTLEEFIESTWGMSPMSTGFWLPFTRQFINKSEAQMFLGVDEKGLDGLTAQGKVESFQPRNGETLLHVLSVEKLKSEISTLMTLRSVAVFLGISDGDVIDLIHNGCLRATSGPEIDGFWEWRLDPVDVGALTRKIERKIIESESPEKSRFTQGRGVVEYLNQYGLSAGKFILDILNDEITPVGKLPGDKITKFLFLKDDVIRYRRSLCAEDLPIDFFNYREKFLEKLEQPKADQIRRSFEERKKLSKLLMGITRLLDKEWSETCLAHTKKGTEFFSITDLAGTAKHLLAQRVYPEKK